MTLKPILIVKSNNKYNQNLVNLTRVGYKIIHSNILQVQELKILDMDIGNKYDIIIITSINAIFALNKLKISNNHIIFTTGESSANILKDLGYNNVIFGNNSAQSLLDKIIREENIGKSKKILYLSGQSISTDVEKELKKIGYDINRKIVYKINEKPLSTDIINNLSNNIIKDIALFSCNGSDIFFNLCQKNNIDLSDKEIHCLSQNIMRHCELLRSGIIKKINLLK